jgi:hypothetical protein
MSTYGYARATINDLKAVPPEGRNTPIGRVSLLVESIPRWYTFDPSSTALADDNNIVQPNVGTGRWIGHGTGLSGQITAYKDSVLLSSTITSLNFNGNNITTTLSDNNTRLNVTVQASGGQAGSWEDLFRSLTDWERIFR